MSTWNRRAQARSTSSKKPRQISAPSARRSGMYSTTCSQRPTSSSAPPPPPSGRRWDSMRARRRRTARPLQCRCHRGEYCASSGQPAAPGSAPTVTPFLPRNGRVRTTSRPTRRGGAVVRFGELVLELVVELDGVRHERAATTGSRAARTRTCPATPGRTARRGSGSAPSDTVPRPRTSSLTSGRASRDDPAATRCFVTRGRSTTWCGRHSLRRGDRAPRPGRRRR